MGPFYPKPNVQAERGPCVVAEEGVLTASLAELQPSDGCDLIVVLRRRGADSGEIRPI